MAATTFFSSKFSLTLETPFKMCVLVKEKGCNYATISAAVLKKKKMELRQTEPSL